MLKESQISEIMSDIVGSIEWDSTIHYDFGHYQEIANKLTLKNKNNLKYPLIALILDVTERETIQPDIYKEYDFRMVIVQNTEHNYTSTQRRDNIFKPILQPIYRKLIDAIKYSGKFRTSNIIEHTKYDRYYLGSQSANQNRLNDFVDAIEIEFRNMKLFKESNC